MDAYIALIRKAADTDYSVNVPDLPGCTTAGSTLDEAYRFAHEAIALYLEDMREDGETPPAPSSLEAIMADPDNRDAVAILVAVPPAKSRSVKVMITMDEQLLAQVDNHAAAAGNTRSGFLADAARTVLRAGQMMKAGGWRDPAAFLSGSMSTHATVLVGRGGSVLAQTMPPRVPLDAQGRVDLTQYREIAPGVYTAERDQDAPVVIETGPLARRTPIRSRKKIGGRPQAKESA